MTPQATVNVKQALLEKLHLEGWPQVQLVTTVGRVRHGRPRWRCPECGHECYPHDRASLAKGTVRAVGEAAGGVVAEAERAQRQRVMDRTEPVPARKAP